ncbi:MAG: 50S ribosomal protein L10 [Candidatus Omnitrophota bacterium]
MKNIGSICREKTVEELQNQWEHSPGRLFISFNKVSAFNFNRLRNSLKKDNFSIFVTKNSLMKMALDSLGVSDFSDFIEGSMGLVFVDGDGIVNACKTLNDFSKENEGFSLRGGFLNDERLDSKSLEDIAKLPPYEVVIGQAVGAIASPLTGFLAVLNNMLLKFVWVISEIKDKKSKGNN